MSGDDMIETELITQVEAFLKEKRLNPKREDYLRLEAQKFFLQLLDITALARSKVMDVNQPSYHANGLNIYRGRDNLSILTSDIPVHGVGNGIITVHRYDDPNQRNELAELTEVETNTYLKVNLLGDRSAREKVLEFLEKDQFVIAFLSTTFLFDKSGKAVKILELPKGIEVRGGKVLKTRDPKYVSFQYVALPVEDNEIETIGMILQEFGQRLEPNPISSAA